MLARLLDHLGYNQTVLRQLESSKLKQVETLAVFEAPVELALLASHGVLQFRVGQARTVVFDEEDRHVVLLLAQVYADGQLAAGEVLLV